LHEFKVQEFHRYLGVFLLRRVSIPKEMEKRKGQSLVSTTENLKETMSKDHKFGKSQDGSAYWHHVLNKGSYYLGDGNIREDVDANPDQLSEDDTLIQKSELTDEQEEQVSAYYKVIANGALRKLAPKQREIWKLRFFKWCSEEEIAAKLGVTVQTVYKHLERAAAKIKIEIDKQQKKKQMLNGNYFNDGFKKKVQVKGVSSTDKEFGERLERSEKEIDAFCKKHPELRNDI
jgi:RNA polymerase sigma factor (sigma-70 family)